MKRDYSIDILKCFAVLIITWSHFEKPLGDYSYLSTGGAFGDALFFFCSGYTIFLGRKANGFLNWYKNRINRIYPTVFAWALVKSLLFNTSNNILEILQTGGGYFVSCIMIFYVFYYFIKLYAIKHLNIVLLISILTTSCSYFILDNSNTYIMYLWQWSLYFSVMLLGGIIGRKRQQESGMKNNVTYKTFIILFVSVICYYSLMYLEQKLSMNMIRMFTILPLLTFSYALHKLCTAKITERIYANKYAHIAIMTIGGLCLEIYLVQPRLLTDKFNSIFPFNLIIMFLIIFVSAYLLRCLSRIWMQTFKDGEYDWKAIIKLY